MPDGEVAICRRVREFRLRTRLTQVAFAGELGWNAYQLANKEHARSPVRYAEAYDLMRRFRVNPTWLATGEGELVEVSDPIHPERLPLSVGRLFSQVYDRNPSLLKARVVWKLPPNWARTEARGKLRELLEGWCSRVVPERMDEFVELLANTAERFLALPDSPTAGQGAAVEETYRGITGPTKASGVVALSQPRLAEALRLRGEIEELQKNLNAMVVTPDSQLLVDSAAASVSLQAVSRLPKSWNELAARVRGATAEPGAKAQLARDMGVSRQAVNKWLREENSGAPSAELIFQLLAWVTAKEAKQKRSADSGGTPAAPKTRARKSKNENQNSSPPKR